MVVVFFVYGRRGVRSVKPFFSSVSDQFICVTFLFRSSIADARESRVVLLMPFPLLLNRVSSFAFPLFFWLSPPKGKHSKILFIFFFRVVARFTWHLTLLFLLLMFQKSFSAWSPSPPPLCALQIPPQGSILPVTIINLLFCFSFVGYEPYSKLQQMTLVSFPSTPKFKRSSISFSPVGLWIPQSPPPPYRLFL